MCEWLLHREWCDVKLFCGGHSFSAHKAVLASVSSFLRRMLLSVPSDDTPMVIILPDFELDAMAFVLYYIYNGEVKLDKQNLKPFFDIINAMQIYVDCQYLPNKIISDEENIFYKKQTGQQKDIFTLKLRNENSELYYNIMKCSDNKSMILQCPLKETDFQDKNARCQNESELSKSRLGNLKKPFGDRQRNSFLRDLFIETYPRNGNVNGRTEGVLAISNECYHSPASVLSTNANGKHLSEDDALSTYNKSTNYSLHSQTIYHNDKKTLYAQNSNKPITDHRSINSTNILVYHEGFSNSFVSPNRLQGSHRNDNKFHTFDFFPSNFQKYMMNISMTQESIASNMCSLNSRVQNHSPAKTITSPKVIYNQVLQSPWCSRKPNDFRPFRRTIKVDELPDIKVDKVHINDDNNNVQPSQILPEDYRKSLLERKDEGNIEKSVASAVADSFSCSYCGQVLTSDESLAIHTRRHLTSARYSCGECGKTFSQLRNFKYHMSIHRGTREFAATCTVCGKYFNDRGYLSSHMKIHRNRKEYKCSQCPKSFNQRVAYNMHVRIHTGVKPHVCDECGKAFSRKMLLKQHQRTHSGERPYACPHCDKRFADRSNMTLHLRLHTGVKPFSCTLCPKSFTKKHHLKSHLNFHTGSKPYSCPRCKLAFTQSSNMRTHMKKCNAPEPIGVNV